MTSGYIPSEEDPDLDDILMAVRAALDADPRLAELPEKEVARRLVLEGHLDSEPSPPLVAEALQAIEIEQGDAPA